MSVNAIELSSDDSEDSFRSDRYFDLLKTGANIVGEDLQEHVDSGDSVSPSASGTSKSSRSQDSGKRTTRRKRAGSTESEVKKRTTAEERQAQKKKLAEERKAAKDANKIYKPGECMKHMTIEMHPVLLEAWYCADIVREAGASGVKVRASSAICDPALVLWTRAVPPTLTNNQGVVELTPSKVQCERGLYVCRLADAAELIDKHSLTQTVQLASQLAACDLTLVLYGVKDYFKISGRKTANSSNKLITEIDLDKAITDLLVSAECDTVAVNTPNELALTVLHFTKAIAEQPHKKAKRDVDEQADFYMRGDNKKCVAVDKDGNGLSRVWQQMLAVLPMASLESSRALCAQYPSPLTMYEALLTPDGVAAVADVGVARAAVPGSRARRIGPEFARKLELLFTATDGNTLID
ncbi:crossover junction endonuclease EME1 [Maniola hyperantus]|uniref:crossover junction endonuclease EME1 n=1 Tax=Aphantopus hyperantus TaxID=2795564 RepID=UPI001568D762|nr:crossover junction endonuclease EME1 [Maniola hyperantus]